MVKKPPDRAAVPPPLLHLCTYVGLVWVGDAPGVRVSIDATSLIQARAQLNELYGPDVTCTLWNEEDAARLR